MYVCPSILYTADDTILQSLIRKHAVELLCRDEPHSPFTNVPTKDEVQSFDKDKGLCCTADSFRLDFGDVPSSAWNTSATHVFTASFRDTHPGCQRSAKEIFAAFVVHFRYLRKVYEQQQEVARVAQE